MTAGLSNAEVMELHRRYGFFLRRRCRIVLRDPSLAEDALQEVYLKLVRSGGTFREAEHPMRWLHRLVDRACLDLLRSRRRVREAKPIEEADDLVHPGVGPDLRRAVLETLESLDDEDKQVAIMAFVDGMTQQEIANELGCSRVTVNKRIATIRGRAAAASEPEGAR